MAPIMVAIARPVRPPMVMVARMEAKGSPCPAYSAANRAANDSPNGTSGSASLRGALLHASEDALGVSHDRQCEQSHGRGIF
jgi:hypothetical protein